MVSDIASILFYASWALVGFICECSSLTFQSILWCLLKLEIVACLHDSFASWWNILLHLWLEQSANTCICFCSDEKLMRQLDASPMQSCLFRKEMHKPIPPPQLWKSMAISLLNIFHFPTVSWNPRSFFHFFLLQGHATSFYPGTSAKSVQWLFPLAQQQCSGTPVLAFSFLRHLSTCITPFVTISFIWILFLVATSLILTGLLKQLKLSWMRMQRWCLFTLEKVPPNLHTQKVSGPWTLTVSS